MKKCLAIVLSIVCLFSLTACGSLNVGTSDSVPEALAIVLAIRKNFCAVPTQLITQEIYDCAYSYGSVDVVLVQGQPQISGSYQINDPHENINSAKHRQIAQQSSSDIIKKISALKATTPEADTLYAINLAADQLVTVSSERKKELIIIDSGLSTAGLMDFSRENLINNTPEYIVSQLAELHALPDLTGITVTWIGLGQTAGEQEKLPSSYKYKLETLWQAILNASGASVNFSTVQLLSEETNCEMPPVSAVPIAEDNLNLQSDNLPSVVGFNENSSVKFVGDKAEFIDPVSAENTLKPVAEYLIATGEQRYIVGMTATHGDPLQRQKLSLERSEACKHILVQYGVAPEQLIPIGLGYKQNSLRVCDTDKNGNLIESQAKINRAVYFISPNSNLADTLVKIANQ